VTARKSLLVLFVVGMLMPGLAMASEPKSVIEAMKKGKELLDAGDIAGAIAACTEAMRLDPKYQEPYFERARLYTHTNRLDEALADYSEAVRLNPKFTDAYCNRGLVYGNKGELDKAIADFTKAIEINPKLAIV